MYGRVAVKVGSNVLAGANGDLDVDRIGHIVDQIANLKRSGTEVVLISSGAVAAGRAKIALDAKLDTVSVRQLFSAVGQVRLMNCYSDNFRRHDLFCAQILTTKENFNDRRHYLNMKSCISTVLENGVVPVVNENDTISVTELMFTDNDELSGLISSMMDCEALIILSNVDGIFTGKPGENGASLIPEIPAGNNSFRLCISSEKSGFGRGGMQTKYNIARKVALEGIPVFIANGKRDGIISDIVRGKDVPYTLFTPKEKRLKGNKKWLAHSESFAKGYLVVNSGARNALYDDSANSLLMVGVVKISGYFKEGDIIGIMDEDGNHLGLGRSSYSSEEAEALVGKRDAKPVILYDYMYLYDF